MRLTQRTPEQLEQLAGKALVLLNNLYNACIKRKYYEGTCGWPDDYGFDKEILEKATEFMESQGLDFLGEITETIRNSDLTKP